MTTLTKTLLAAAVIGFAVGSVVDFSNLTTNVAWTVALPLGAVFFGLFLISLMLQKEMAEFDRETAERLKLAESAVSAPTPKPREAAVQTMSRLKEATL